MTYPKSGKPCILIASSLYQSAKQNEVAELGKNSQLLVVGESLGIIIPLAFLASLTAVYHGPNASNLGTE